MLTQSSEESFLIDPLNPNNAIYGDLLIFTAFKDCCEGPAYTFLFIMRLMSP